MAETKLPLETTQHASNFRYREIHEYPPIMTLREVAEVLRITPRTLYNRRSIKANLPPSIQINGTKIVYRRDEVQKWLETGGA